MKLRGKWRPGRQAARLMAALLTIAALLTMAAAPAPPCGAAASPASAPVDADPAVAIWTPDELGAGWQPPRCVGWSGGGGFRMLFALSGRFTLHGGRDAVLTRFGAVSALVGVPYWSVTTQRWQPLLIAATALDGRDPATPRGDFTADELRAGGDVLLRQTDKLTGAATYRMRVLEAAPARVVITIENTSTLRQWMVPLFAPGELQSFYVLEADAANPDIWTFYVLSRSARTASVLIDGHAASFVNRAVAFWRHIAGIPADRAPPEMR